MKRFLVIISVLVILVVALFIFYNEESHQSPSGIPTQETKDSMVNQVSQDTAVEHKDIPPPQPPSSTPPVSVGGQDTAYSKTTVPGEGDKDRRHKKMGKKMSNGEPAVPGEDDQEERYKKMGKRSAVLGYSYFKNIQQHETRNIIAYVSVINAMSKVIDTLKEINAADLPERPNDTATIIARNIVLFKALDIQLVNGGDSDFIIKPLSDNRQVIDTVVGNSWTWAVTPRTNKLHGRLVMNIIAEKPDGTHEPFSIINIPITIIIDKAIGRTLWQWMMDNPEKVITIILLPFIAFFWKQIVGLFKRKKDSSQG